VKAFQHWNESPVVKILALHEGLDAAIYTVSSCVSEQSERILVNTFDICNQFLFEVAILGLSQSFSYELEDLKCLSRNDALVEV
jgi:hypothetical protein